MRLLALALLLAASALAGDLTVGHGFPSGKTPPSLLQSRCIKAPRSADAQLLAVWEIVGADRFLLLGAAPQECDNAGCSREISLTVAELDSSEQIGAVRRMLHGCPAIQFEHIGASVDDQRAVWKLTDKSEQVEFSEVNVVAGYSQESEGCTGGPARAVEPCKIHAEIGDALRLLSKDAHRLTVVYADAAQKTELVWNSDDGDYDDGEEAE